MPQRKNTIQDILLRLVICDPTTLETGCWEWPGAKSVGGYGKSILNRRYVYVHAAVYEHFCGPMPEGLELDHLCRNRACANFEHLEPVTHRENRVRGRNANEEKTHCLRGHPLSGETCYVNAKGHRRCRVCKMINWRRRKEEVRDAAQ
jgi:hypothetical protein